jgi:hypothetical protein
LSDSNNATYKTVSIKLEYVCGLSVLDLYCTQRANVDNGKYTWARLVTGREDDLLKAPLECSPDGVICLKAKRLLPSVAPSNVRILTVWYENVMASCPCAYLPEPGSTERMSCKYELTAEAREVRL